MQFDVIGLGVSTLDILSLVEAFPSGDALAALIRAAGFDRIESIPLTLGIATLSICRREG